MSQTFNPKTHTLRAGAIRLTDSKIGALKPPASGYRFVWDAETTGLAVRVSHTGSVKFVFDFTVNGRRRRMVLGDWTQSYGIDKARHEVSGYKVKTGDGLDPLATKQNAKQAFRERWTVADLADDFLREHAELVKRPSSIASDRGILRGHILPRLGHLAVADVTSADIEGLMNAMARAGRRVRANRARALLSTMFARAVHKRKLRADNPVVGVARFHEEPRERYLTPDETVALMQALDEHRNQRTADVFRLLFMTGARRGEVLSARWDEFNLDLGIWTKPSAHTKQKRRHLVPLNSAALALLRNMKAKARPDAVFLFPGDSRTEPIKNVKPAWAQILQRAGIQNLRIHDLRHSFASALLERGVGLQVIGKLLGHTQAATTQRYAHLLVDTLREATERLTQALPVPTTTAK